MGKLQEIDTAATEMAEIFKRHAKVFSVVNPEYVGPSQSYVDTEGLEQLAERFGQVPIALRPVVYSTFLDKLSEMELYYDIENFKGTVH